jgi:cyclophilin family peptidyl-prolyl cis-trans isomerase/HEAT repeat protein
MTRPATIDAARRAPAAAVVLAGALLACASVPAPAPAPAVPYEDKIAWILRLEDQRVLRDPLTLPAVTVPRGATQGAAAGAPAPDLPRLLTDADARVRRRAALAIGRVGLPAGVAPLAAALGGDPEPEVRQAAAFALGLLGDRSAVAPLGAALADGAPMVKGRAAEALGALGDAASAPAIGALVRSLVDVSGPAGQSPRGLASDDVAESHDPAVDAFELGVLALGRLKAYEPLAAAVLDAAGEPQVRWWPVAAALARTEDRRALRPLLAFARGDGRVARAFAARGLGALKDAAAVDALSPLVDAWPRDTPSAIAAVRALAQIGDRRAGPVLLRLLAAKDLDPLLQLEVVAALGPVGGKPALDALLDLVSHPSPAIRAAAWRSLKAVDPQAFVMGLSGVDADAHWSVRAAIASLLGTLDRDTARPRLDAMLADPNPRVVAAVLPALVKIGAPDTGQALLGWLKHGDVFVRAAAAAGIGELKPPGGERALADAFRAASADGDYGARTSALDALVKYGQAAAVPILREALADKDWAVRVHAASLLKPFAPNTDPAAAIRPAPTGHAPDVYRAAELVAPTVSPHVFLETTRGTIEIELAVLDAPLTCRSFMALARRGFFDGLVFHRVVPNFVAQGGDPHGDGEGGPGYTLRDENNTRPFLRGTVGMARDWADTAGSQFFLTVSPQPHLDGRYTAFGRVVAGLDVIDRIQPWDTIVRMRVWDGKTMSGELGARGEGSEIRDQGSGIGDQGRLPPAAPSRLPRRSSKSGGGYNKKGGDARPLFLR